jgi:branched-chain amino acid transport system permease protein
MNYLGYNERRYRIAAFTISGAVSGLTGALHAMQLSFASPSNLYFLLSGEVIIWTIVGGAGTLVGPIVGAGLIHYIEHVFSSQIVWWNIPVGIFFILVVIFMPEGLAGGIKRLKEHGFFED